MNIYLISEVFNYSEGRLMKNSMAIIIKFNFVHRRNGKDTSVVPQGR